MKAKGYVNYSKYMGNRATFIAGMVDGNFDHNTELLQHIKFADLSLNVCIISGIWNFCFNILQWFI